MTIGDMMKRSCSMKDITKKILPDVLLPNKFYNLELILKTFIKRYRSKLELPDMNKTVKPLLEKKCIRRDLSRS